MNVMTDQQASNLFLLARHIRDLVRKLDMCGYHHCGTPLCVAGEAASMPHFIAQGLRMFGSSTLQLNGDLAGVTRLGEELFGLTENESWGLFGTSDRNFFQTDAPTSQQWSEAALRVLAEHGYSSDPAMAQDRPMFCGAGTDNDCRYPACSCAENLEDVRAFCARMAEVELKETADVY